MIPPEIVFLTPHLLERARPVLDAPRVPGGPLRALRALLGALRAGRAPRVAARRG